MQSLSRQRFYPEWYAPNAQQKHFGNTRKDSTSHGGNECLQQAPQTPADRTPDLNRGPQAEPLEHLAAQKQLLLGLLESGIGKEPGNQLAEDLEGLIQNISTLQSREEKYAQLCQLNAALAKRGVATINRGHSVIECLSQAIELSRPGPPQCSPDPSDAAVVFFNHREPNEVRQYVDDEIATLEMIVDQGVPVDAVIPECMTLLDRINLMNDRRERASLVRQVFVWMSRYVNVNSPPLGPLRTEVTDSAPPASQDEAPRVGIHSVSSIARDHPDIAGLVQALASQELFRGLTTTSEGYVERAVLKDGTVQWRAPEASEAAACRLLDGGHTLNTLREIQAKGKVFMPLMWGFRVFDPAEGLAAKEVNTIQAYAEMSRSLQGSVEVQAPLILADIHAQHNQIPPAIYEPYYREVARFAQEQGVKTIYLSAIYKQLDVTREQVEQRGCDLVTKPNSESPASVVLPANYWAHVKTQARNTVARFPELFKAQTTSYKKTEAFCGKKALDYVRFRAGEGECVLPRLGELIEANGAPVLVAHVADPNSGLVGVNGLYIRAKDDMNSTVAAIPWGAS